MHLKKTSARCINSLENMKHVLHRSFLSLKHVPAVMFHENHENIKDE